MKNEKEKIGYIRFYSAINPQSAACLMTHIERLNAERVDRIKIIMAGCFKEGDIEVAFELYNYITRLHHLPVDTHNFGKINLIGMVLFCAGRRRFSIHDASFELYPWEMLDSTLNSIAKKISNSNTHIEAASEIIKTAKLISSVEARKMGFVHDISEILYTEGVPVFSVDDISVGRKEGKII